MFFIGGISQGRKLLEYGKTLICKCCGSGSGCQVMMTFYYFSFFFIPLFRWSRRYFVTMNCCGAVYELDPEVGRMIARGEDVEILNQHLKLVQEGRITRPVYTNPDGSEAQEMGQPGTLVRCPACREQVPGDSNYCPKCGQRLR